MILLYFLAFLDRNNMAYAAKALEDNLGLTASAFGFASGIFFIGYFLFEIPSNAGTIKFGPRIWFARILISWGIFATLLGFVRTPLELYICRFMLGVCEAGFFPSVVYYFTVFFPEKYRTKILGMFIIVQPLSNAVGSPISGFILNIQHDWFGFAPATAVYPRRAAADRHRPADPVPDQELAQGRRLSERGGKGRLMSNAGRSKSGSKITLGDFLKGIKNKKYLLYALLNFGMVCGIYGFGTWLPSIITALSGSDIFRVSLLALIPYGWPRCWCTRGACGPAKPKAWRVRRPQHGGRRHRHLHRRTAVFIHARQHFHRCGRGRAGGGQLHRQYRRLRRALCGGRVERSDRQQRAGLFSGLVPAGHRVDLHFLLRETA